MQDNFPNILSSDAAPWMFMLSALLAALIFAAVCRLFAGYFDAGRVEKHIRFTGGRLLERKWEPFGPGWFGTHGARIYRILYEDDAGRLHRAHVKTSLFSGVYLADDTVIKNTGEQAATDLPTSGSFGQFSHPATAQAQGFTSVLQAENAQLNERIRVLEAELKKRQ